MVNNTLNTVFPDISLVGFARLGMRPTRVNMAIRAVIGFLMSIYCGVLLADESEILSIRKEFQKIQQALPSLKSETVELEDYALEGADATAYRDRAGNIRAIKASLFHESGKEFKDFYYKDGSLIFAFYVTHRYNQHTSITPEIAKQEGIDEAFDPKKTSITEDRYYFSKSKMIRWIDQNKKVIETKTSEFLANEAEVLETSNDLLSKFSMNKKDNKKGSVPLSKVVIVR